MIIPKLINILWHSFGYFCLFMTAAHFVEQGIVRFVNWYRLRQWKRGVEVR